MLEVSSFSMCLPTLCIFCFFSFFLSFFFDESHYSWYKLIYSWSFPGDTSGKEPSCQCRGHKRREFHLWVRRSHGGRHGKDWVPKNWCFWTVVLEKTLESPWTAKRSKQSILKEISPEYSLEGLMLRLKLQYWSTWCEELTHLKRPWCWERLKAGGEGDVRRWDGWIASSTQGTWVSVNSGSWWWTGRPVVLHSIGSQSQTWMSDWTELMCMIVALHIFSNHGVKWTYCSCFLFYIDYFF